MENTDHSGSSLLSMHQKKSVKLVMEPVCRLVVKLVPVELGMIMGLHKSGAAELGLLGPLSFSITE